MLSISKCNSRKRKTIVYARSFGHEIALLNKRILHGCGFSIRIGDMPIADGVDGNADQWVTDPDTGKPGVSRMNKDEMASITDELSGTALVLNASNTMRDGVSKEASDKWRVTQTTKKRTRTMPVVWPLAIVTLLLLACELGAWIIQSRSLL